MGDTGIWAGQMVTYTLVSGLIAAFMAMSDKFSWPLFLPVAAVCIGGAFLARPPVTITVDELEVISRSLWRTVRLPITSIDSIEKVWIDSLVMSRPEVRELLAIDGPSSSGSG